jgi:hypothetical protein
LQRFGYQTYKFELQDFKCSIEIMDYSDRGMKVSFFEKTEQNMPPPPGAGDVVLMRGVKASTRPPGSRILTYTFSPNCITELWGF